MIDENDDEEETPLTVPFKQLIEEGILALENFSCCTRCGCIEIEDEIKEREKEFHGFCFYHAQDDENRRNGHSFYLCYGSTEKDDNGWGWALAIEVGHRIVEVLNQHGIKTNWNGDIARKIEVLQ